MKMFWNKFVNHGVQTDCCCVKHAIWNEIFMDGEQGEMIEMSGLMRGAIELDEICN